MTTNKRLKIYLSSNSCSSVLQQQEVTRHIYWHWLNILFISKLRKRNTETKIKFNKCRESAFLGSHQSQSRKGPVKENKPNAELYILSSLCKLRLEINLGKIPKILSCLQSERSMFNRLVCENRLSSVCKLPLKQHQNLTRGREDTFNLKKVLLTFLI